LRHSQQQTARLGHDHELTGRSHDLAVQFPRLFLVQRHLKLGELNAIDSIASRAPQQDVRGHR
jgi:hypothetical protein